MLPRVHKGSPGLRRRERSARRAPDRPPAESPERWEPRRAPPSAARPAAAISSEPAPPVYSMATAGTSAWSSERDCAMQRGDFRICQHHDEHWRLPAERSARTDARAGSRATVRDPCSAPSIGSGRTRAGQASTPASTGHSESASSSERSKNGPSSSDAQGTASRSGADRDQLAQQQALARRLTEQLRREAGRRSRLAPRMQRAEETGESLVLLGHAGEHQKIDLDACQRMCGGKSFDRMTIRRCRPLGCSLPRWPRSSAETPRRLRREPRARPVSRRAFARVVRP